VSQVRDAEDRRRTPLGPTDTGAELFDSLIPSPERINERLWEAPPASERALRQRAYSARSRTWATSHTTTAGARPGKARTPGPAEEGAGDSSVSPWTGRTDQAPREVHLFAAPTLIASGCGRTCRCQAEGPLQEGDWLDLAVLRREHAFGSPAWADTSRAGTACCGVRGSADVPCPSSQGAPQADRSGHRCPSAPAAEPSVRARR
jgi:hypothetical protein